MIEYFIEKSTVDLKSLTVELNASITSQEVSHITWHSPDGLYIYYPASLESGDETLLNQAVEDHAG